MYLSVLPPSLLLDPAELVLLLNLAQYVRAVRGLPERHLRQLLLNAPAVLHREEPGRDGRERLLSIVICCIFSEFARKRCAVCHGFHLQLLVLHVHCVSLVFVSHPRFFKGGGGLREVESQATGHWGNHN